ncbi:unknown function [Vibrio phage K469]
MQITPVKPVVIAVDFDLTLCDTLNPWLKWAFDRCKMDWETASSLLSIKDWSGSDWVPIMKDMGIEDPFAYWKQPDLCDNLYPMSDSVEALRGLKQLAATRGIDLRIICVSHCVPEHIATKERFLDEKCGGIFDAFISASEKQYVDFDLIIDDSFTVARKCVDAGRKVIVPTTSKAEVSSIYGSSHSNLYQWGEEYGDFWFTLVHYIGLSRVLEIAMLK